MSRWPPWERGEYRSASSIKTYLDCEKQFEFNYLTDLDGAEKDTQYADLGTAVHDAIEMALQVGREDFRSRAMDMYHANADDLDLPSDRLGEGRKCISKAADYIEKRDDIEIKEVEAEIPYTLNELDQKMAAKLDIVANGEIWDWKTGSNRDKEWVQAAVYTAAYGARYGEGPDCIRFVYLKKGEVYTHEPGKKEYKKLVNILKKIARAKESGKFRPDPGDACYWCPYEYSCPASEISYDDVDWVNY